MSMVFVPHDTAAVALGANKVAAALQHAGATVVRTGSRGALWLEPMVEVATPAGRIAYGPVMPADLTELLAADLLTGGAHRLRLGPPANLPFLAAQQRLVFARCGITDPLSVAEYQAHGGLKGVRCAFEIGPSRHHRGDQHWPNCAAAVAPVFPPASNGAPPPKPPALASSSSATPMKAIPAPSPTAC